MGLVDWAHWHSGPEYRVEDSGGVIRPTGQRDSYKGLLPIKVSIRFKFIHVGINFLYHLTRERARVDLVDLDLPDLDPKHIRNSGPLISSVRSNG